MYDHANSIKIVHINLRGLRANGQSLLQYLETLNFPEIVTINETKLNKSVVDPVYQNYLCASRRDSPHGHHGSLILVKRGLNDVHELTSFQETFSEEVIGIRINGKNNRPTINVCTYYNPPNSFVNPEIFRHCNRLKGATVIAGDLNCKSFAWGSTKDDELGDHLLHVINENSLAILNDGSMTRSDPFYGTEQALDLILCNYSALKYFKRFFVGPNIGSDHYPTVAELQHVVITPTVYTRNWKNVDWDAYKNILESTTFENPETAEDVDHAVSNLCSAITNALDVACPLIVKRNKKSTSFTPEMISIVKEKRRLRRQKSEAARTDNSAQARHLQGLINSRNKDLKKLLNKKTKDDLNRDCEKLNKEKNNAKFFNLFGRLTNQQNSSPKLCPKIAMEDGTEAATDKEKSELFANHLEKCHQIGDYHGFDNNWRSHVEEYVNEREEAFEVEKTAFYSAPETDDNSNLLSKVTVEEIADRLRQCKNKSAAGEDKINYVVLKKLPRKTLTDLSTIFNKCLHLGYFPDQWKKASVIMIPKQGKDGKLAKNHRPISLLPCVGKLFERIIADRLSSYLEKESLISPFQSGFRKGHMAAEQLLRLVEEASNSFKQKQITASLFLDAEAAFDKAWHDGIRYKLHRELKLPQRLVRLISSFLTDRSLSVRVGDETSRSVKMAAGTPQGSSLSPLLYIILVNDIPKEVTDTASLSQFADDVALWSRAYTFHEAIRRLQKSVNMLEGWCRRWRIKLNASKSNLLIIHRLQEKKPEDLCLLLFDDIIRPCDNAKFLGLELDSRLSLKKHYDGKVRSAKIRLNLFRMLARGGVDNKTLVRLHKTYIRPLIEYGCIATLATSNSTVQVFQRVQNEFLRVCLNLPSYIRTDLLHEAAGLETIRERLVNLGKKNTYNAIKSTITISEL